MCSTKCAVLILTSVSMNRFDWSFVHDILKTQRRADAQQSLEHLQFLFIETVRSTINTKPSLRQTDHSPHNITQVTKINSVMHRQVLKFRVGYMSRVCSRPTARPSLETRTSAASRSPRPCSHNPRSNAQKKIDGYRDVVSVRM